MMHSDTAESFAEPTGRRLSIKIYQADRNLPAMTQAERKVSWQVAKRQANTADESTSHKGANKQKRKMDR